MRFEWVLVGCLVLGLPACLETGQGTGAPAVASNGAVFSADAGSKTEAGPDVVQEDSKPHPGGVSAPLNEWEGDAKFALTVRGNVSQCTETLHRANGLDIQVVKSRLNGRLVLVDTGDGTEKPLLVGCALRFIRVTEGGADALLCTDILLKPDCTFHQEMEIADPGSAAFHLAKELINLLHPQPYPACVPPESPDFATAKNEFDFSGLATENPPPCGQQRIMIMPGMTIHDKLKGGLERKGQ